MGLNAIGPTGTFNVGISILIVPKGTTLEFSTFFIVQNLSQKTEYISTYFAQGRAECTISLGEMTSCSCIINSLSIELYSGTLFQKKDKAAYADSYHDARLP